MSSKRSRVHPTFKTKYRVGNWPEYDRGLVDRGDLTIWISSDAIDAWRIYRTSCCPLADVNKIHNLLYLLYIYYKRLDIKNDV